METTRPSDPLIEKVARELFAVENCTKFERLSLEKQWQTRLNDKDRADYKLLASAALDALGVRDEWLILKHGDEWPHGLTTWTEAEARAAADRNSERWGKYNAVHRYVTEWEVSE